MAANLITLSELKQYKGITNNTEDSELGALITKASALVKTYIGRSLIDYFTEEKVEVSSGGRQSIFLTEVPINELVSVEYSTDYGKTYTSLKEYESFARNLETDTIDVIGADRFPYGINGYKITYTGGYEKTPEDLKLAVMDLVMFYQKSEMAVKSTRAPGANNAQIEYIMNTTLPSHIRRVLDLYRLDL